MSNLNMPEVWQRGPVAGIPPLLQPVAHALLQAEEEVRTIMLDFPASDLWVKPDGAAAAGFHLQHLTGVLDRLFSYANGKSLTNEQLEYLSREGYEDPAISTKQLVDSFSVQITESIDQLRNTSELILTEIRTVGRKKIPSTVIGLLFHAAEHTMRHLGQLIVTVRWVNSNQ